MRIDFPEHVRFNCSKCGLCCGDTSSRIRHVLLSLSDAREISETANRAISDFASPVDGKEPYMFEMKKTAKGKCVFLENNECRIYEVRPLICRFYPFELKTREPGVYSFTATDECPGVSSAKGEATKVLEEGFFEALLKLANARLNGCSCSDF